MLQLPEHRVRGERRLPALQRRHGVDLHDQGPGEDAAAGGGAVGGCRGLGGDHPRSGAGAVGTGGDEAARGEGERAATEDRE